MIDYEVIEQKEILHEVFAGLLADIHRVIRDRNIIDPLHPLAIFRKKVSIIWSDIITSNYSTMEDMTELKGVYKFIKSYVEDLQQIGKSGMKYIIKLNFSENTDMDLIINEIENICNEDGTKILEKSWKSITIGADSFENFSPALIDISDSEYIKSNLIRAYCTDPFDGTYPCLDDIVRELK